MPASSVDLQERITPPEGHARLCVVHGDIEKADQAALGRLRAICLSFDGVEEGELQNRALFRVGRRRFALFNGLTSPERPRWSSSGRSIHFLADPLELESLKHDARFQRSPHHGDRGWLAVRVDDELDWAEVADLLETAYHQVVPRSPLS